MFSRVKTSSDTWEFVPSNEVMTLIDKIRAERKLALDGGDGVGPARQPKSTSEARKPGKPRDTLVDDLVVGVEEPKRGGERRQVVYCIGCKKKTVGRDPNRIKQHAKDCTVRFLGQICCIQSRRNIFSRHCQRISPSYILRLSKTCPNGHIQSNLGSLMLLWRRLRHLIFWTWRRHREQLHSRERS